MGFRRILLRIMLWSLAAAAGLGILAMLFFREETIWRVIGTAVITAIAAGLMLACTRGADNPKARTAGVLAMALVVLEFMLAMLLIWATSLSFIFGGRREEEIGLTMFALAVTGIPAVAMVRLLQVPKARFASPVVLSLARVGLAGMVLASWVEGTWRLQETLWETAGAGGSISVVGLMCLAGIGVDRRHWRWVGVASVLVALAMVLIHIWA